MDDLKINNEIEYTRQNAKAEFNNGNYPLAKIMLETLWENSNKEDSYLLFDYGRALRKTNESHKFVEICRELINNQQIMSNKYIISTLCWCLYDSYIKNYSFKDNPDDFNDFIEKAEYIINNSIQLDATEHYKTPYFLTVKKVVRAYTERSSKNYKEIIRWLSYLDPDKLSEKVFNFQDEMGKDRELSSPKEFYYQHMAKSLEKTKRYEDCVKICNAALKEIKKLHYRNHVWFKARLYYCRCMIQENIENAIEEYKNLANKENFWFMFHKLSLIYFSINRIPEALLYASKAFCCKFENEKMVGLMQDTAMLWQATGNNSNAKLFFHAAAYYRNLYCWSFPEELKYAVDIFEINVEEKPNIKEIQHVSKDYVTLIEGKPERLEGRILKFLPHGQAGFIKPDTGSDNIYFNVKDVVGKRQISKDDKVSYELAEGAGGRTRAVKISIRS